MRREHRQRAANEGRRRDRVERGGLACEREGRARLTHVEKREAQLLEE